MVPGRVLALALLLGVAAPASAEELTLSVAISMKDAIEELGRGFTQARPGVVLRHNLGASGELSKQIEAGAPPDCLISERGPPNDALERQGGPCCACPPPFHRPPCDPRTAPMGTPWPARTPP